MKSLPLRQAEKTLLTAASGDAPKEVSAYTFKKDRSLTVRVTEEGVMLCEDGYVKEETFFPAEEKSGLKKALKEAFSREFPRSHRVYCT